MKKIYALAVSAVVGATAVFGFSPSAKATVILDVVGGELIGARNVNVDGTLYDVTFDGGTCVDQFSGCDNAADDFTFTTFQTAAVAAAALIEQVFLDSAAGLFDSEPELTRGCDGLAVCFFSIPYSLSGGTFFALIAENLADDGVDVVSDSFTSRFTDYSSPFFPSDSFAIFTLASGGPIEVDEPGTLLLFGCAMLGLGLVCRKNRRSERV